MDDFFHGQLRVHPTSVERRLRGGKIFVACAPQAFADPSAFIARWSYPVGTPVIQNALLARDLSPPGERPEPFPHRWRLAAVLVWFPKTASDHRRCEAVPSLRACLWRSAPSAWGDAIHTPVRLEPLGWGVDRPLLDVHQTDAFPAQSPPRVCLRAAVVGRLETAVAAFRRPAGVSLPLLRACPAASRLHLLAGPRLPHRRRAGGHGGAGLRECLAESS